MSKNRDHIDHVEQHLQLRSRMFDRLVREDRFDEVLAVFAATRRKIA